MIQNKEVKNLFYILHNCVFELRILRWTINLMHCNFQNPGTFSVALLAPN